MFTNTTTFYPANVWAPPSGVTEPNYRLQFDDDDDDGEVPIRSVKAKFVVPYRDD